METILKSKNSEANTAILIFSKRWVWDTVFQTILSSREIDKLYFSDWEIKRYWSPVHESWGSFHADEALQVATMNIYIYTFWF